MLKKIVNSLIKNFNNKKINYAVLRNYENFPNFSSDLDIITNERISKIKGIIYNIAKKNDFTHLIHIKNLVTNISYINSVNKFFLLKKNKNNIFFFEIDFGRAIVIYGLPYFQLKKNSQVFFYKKKLKIISPEITYINHIFQLFKTSQLKNKKKFFKYKKKVLEFFNIKNKSESKILFENLIIFCLMKNFIFFFKTLILFNKVFYVFNSILTNPILSIKFMIIRIFDIYYYKKNLKQKHFKVYNLKKQILDFKTLPIVIKRHMI